MVVWAGRRRGLCRKKLSVFGRINFVRYFIICLVQLCHQGLGWQLPPLQVIFSSYQLPCESPEPSSSDIRGKIKHYFLGRSTLFCKSSSTGSEGSAGATGFGINAMKQKTLPVLQSAQFEKSAAR